MFRPEALFRNRQDAGRRLAEALARFACQDAVVLALPRGGVPVGYEVATALNAPLDVILVRKIGAPGQPELGLGAIVDGTAPQIVWNERVLEEVRPSPAFLEAEQQRQFQEIERRRSFYRGERESPNIRDRIALVVDDGIATGGTVRAVLRTLAQAGPKRLVLAVPVAPPDSIAELQAEADEIVCLATPEPFYAVGLHYRDFDQTSDEEVVDLLRRANQRMETQHDHRS